MVSNEYAYRDINICECEFCGRMVKCMKNPMPNILMLYGSDWKIPKSIVSSRATYIDSIN